MLPTKAHGTRRAFRERYRSLPLAGQSRIPGLVRGMLTRVEGKTSRRAFLGLAAAGAAAGVASGAAKIFGRPAASGHPAALTASPRPWKPRCRRTRCPATRTGSCIISARSTRSRGTRAPASVLTGESFPLFVSTTSSGFTGDRVPARLVPGHRRAQGLVLGAGARRPAEERRRRAADQHGGHRLGPGGARPDRRLARRRLPAPAGRRLRRAAVRAGHRPVGLDGGQGRDQELRRRPGRPTTCGAATTCTRTRRARYTTGRWWSAWTGRTTERRRTVPRLRAQVVKLAEHWACRSPT